jgi:uncharacterized OB-fold protein
MSDGSDTTTSSAGRRPPSHRGLADTAPFWDALRSGRLLLQYCTVAQRFQHHPRPVSIYTGRDTLVWREVGGAGVIYALTWLNGARPAGASGHGSSCIATVELNEGVRLVARLSFIEGMMPAIGMPVRFDGEPTVTDPPLPAFRLT